jgi:Ras-related protein Rab-8A
MGILLTYDCTDEASFTSIRNWTQQIKMHASAQVAKILIGNKCDREDRKISREQGEALARELEMPFFEASAKNNINVQEAFAYIAKEIKDKRQADPMGTASAVRVGETKKAGRKKCCK